MKKVIIILLLGFLFYIPKVSAIEDITLENRVIENQVYVDIKFNTDIKGLSGVLEYDKSNLNLVSCVSKSNYNVQLKNNILLIDNYEVKTNSIIAECTFDIKNKDLENHNITLNNINLSVNEKLTGSDKSITSYTLNNTVPNINRINYKYIVLGIDILIILFVLIYVIANKKYRAASLLIIILVAPSIIKAVNINNDDISNYRNILLTNNPKYLKDLDLDNDNKISVNDLVLARIKTSKPIPIFIEKIASGNNEYKTNLVKTIYVNSTNKLVKARYCITTGEKCSPVKDIGIVNNSFDVKFDNNVKEQRVCVYIESENGLSNEVCDHKTYKVDNSEPSIKVINNNFSHNLDSKFEPYKNIKVSYGNISGHTICTETLKLGKNTITCEAIADNGNNAKATYTVNASYTYNKSVVFYGDSITYGRAPYRSGLANYSWVNYIKDNYDLKTIINRGKNGWTVSNINGTGLYKLVEQDKDKSYDYVILHGGCNDVYYNVPVGELKKDDFSGNYNTSTFTGGLETYLYKVTKTWPNAKIGYIINYQTPYNPERSNGKSDSYYERTISILKKWKIDYIDLYGGTDDFGKKYSEDILKVNVLSKKYSAKEYDQDYTKIGSYGYTYDNLHLSREGYKVISPYIYKWMNSLKEYKK